MNGGMRPWTTVVIGGATALLVAGCGSSSGGANTASTAKGTMITIMGTTALSGVNSPYPEAEAGWKAAVNEINATGGVKDHPLKLVVCDNQGDPNLSGSCARKAVAQKASAVIGTMNNETTTVLPPLQKAGIPFVGDIVQTALDASSSVSFPIGAGGFNLNAAVGAVAKKVGCSKVGAVIIQAPNITKTIETAMATSLKAEGISYAGPTYSPTSQTDFTSTMAAVEHSGADCVSLALDEPQTTGFLTAWKQSGSSIKVLSPGVTLASLDKIATVATGIYIYSPSRLPTDPAVKETVAAMKKFGASTISSASLDAYGAVHLLADALRNSANPTNPATALKAMASLTSASSGSIFPAYTTTKTAAVAGQGRVFNPDVVVYQVEGTSTKNITGWIPIPGVAGAK